MSDDFTPEQSKAARAILGWKVQDLVRKSKLGVNTVTRFESGQPSRRATAELLQKVLESAGVEFADGGVFPRKSKV